ncbi:MAG: 4Fe-4S binding protein [Chloroflexota bacterium]
MSDQVLASVEKETCTGCGQCITACSRGAIYMVDGIADVDPTICRGCGVCAQACPTGALSMVYPARDIVSVESQPSIPAPRPRAEVVQPFNPMRSPKRQSLLARAATAVAPAALNLAIAVGQACLDRIGAVGSNEAAVSNRPAGRCRRMRRRGR